MKNLCTILSLITIVFFNSCSGSGEGPVCDPCEPLTTTQDLVDLYTGDKRGTSTLTRSAGQISFKIETTNLIPGHVYQVMCAVFNQPENCVGPCDAVDFQTNNADGSGVEAISFVMAGKLANSTTATFEGTLKINDITTYDWIPADGPDNGWGGLQDPLTAQINLLVRSQGPYQENKSDEQFNTWANACSYDNCNILSSNCRVPEEIGECAFIQTSDHVAPSN
jgi:hypothetical protein